MAGGRPFRPSAPRRAAFAGLLTLLFLASLAFLLSSPPASSSRSTLSPPSRLAAIRRHAADHAAVLAAYAAHARKLKEASAAQSLSFSDLSSDLSALSSRLAAHQSLPEDARRPLEKEARDRIKFARLLAADSKEGFDTQAKIQKLSDTVFAVGEHLARSRRAGRMSSRIAAGSTPKSLHCLAMRLLEARLAKPSAFADDPDPSPAFQDPALYHYAIFSDNVLAASVVITSATRAAADPSRHVFHVVTAPMYLPAFRVWFARRPPPLGVHVQLIAYSDFPFLNASFSPVLRQIDTGKRDVALVDYLRFYLPDMFPALHRVVLLEDDVVVQKDLAGLWHVDLDGKVNGAVEMCFGGFRRYRKYLNFTQDIVRERFNPTACAWEYGVNVFDLQAWRRDGCTELFHQYMDLNEDGAAAAARRPQRHTAAAAVEEPHLGKMKTILASETMDIPEEVTVKVSAKMVSVTGPRGTLTRNFKHLNLDFQLQEGGRKLKVDAWFGTRRTMAAIRTAISHVQNLITGVTKGFRYKMRFVYAHFPINASINSGSKGIEIRNFLGEKKVRKVDMLDGVTILRSEKVKDEIVLDGNDIELVSRSAALINQKCHVKKKDIRKFLDGIYVSDMGAIKEE